MAANGPLIGHQWDTDEGLLARRGNRASGCRRLSVAAAGIAAVGLVALGVAVFTGRGRAGAVPLSALGESTRLAEEKICEDFPYFKFIETEYDNLENTGPDSKYGEGMVYDTMELGKGAGSEFHHQILLLVNGTNPDYKPFSPRMNGMQGKYGSINVKSGSKVSVEIHFVERRSGKRLTLPKLAWTFFDLDEGTDHKSSESVTIGGFDKYFLTDDTEVKVKKLDNGATKFQASTKGTGEDNPLDPSFLSAQQKNRAVTLLFRDVSMLKFTLAASAGTGPRFFTFVGRPSLLCAVTVQAGFKPPLPDLEYDFIMQEAVKAHKHDIFKRYIVHKGQMVNEGDDLFVTEDIHDKEQIYKATAHGRVSALQPLKGGEKIALRLDDKTAVVIDRMHYGPLKVGTGVVSAGPARKNDRLIVTGPDMSAKGAGYEKPLTLAKEDLLFKKYLKEVGQPVRVGEPYATATVTKFAASGDVADGVVKPGDTVTFTSFGSGSVHSILDDMEPGTDLAVVDGKPMTLITVGPFKPLATSANNHKAAMCSNPKDMVLVKYLAKEGDVKERGDTIAVVKNKASGKEHNVTTGMGGVVTSLQPLEPGDEVSRVLDGNLATVGKFPPLAVHPTEGKTDVPSALAGKKFVKYHVKVGDLVETETPIAALQGDSDQEVDVLSSKPGRVMRLQENLRSGMIVDAVLQDSNVATIGPLPDLEVTKHEAGSFGPKDGKWVFDDWKVKEGDAVEKGDAIAVLNSTKGVSEVVEAGQSGTVKEEQDYLGKGDIVNRDVTDMDLATIGRITPEGVTPIVEAGVEVPDMKCIFKSWEVKDGEYVHVGNPVAKVLLPTSARRLADASGAEQTIYSPASGSVNWLAPLTPGETIDRQSLGPRIARLWVGPPWWLFLLAALIGLCCVLCMLHSVMKKDTVYKPLAPPKEAAPPPPPPPAPKVAAPPPPGLDFSDGYTIKTVEPMFRPLGIKHEFVAPIKANAFSVNSYAKMSLGVQTHMTLVGIDGTDISKTTDFAEVSRMLDNKMKNLPIWPLAIRFRTESGQEVEKKFERKPIGIEFTNQAPIMVGQVYPDSPALTEGVKKGWVVTKIGDVDVHENHAYRDLCNILAEGLEPLPDTKTNYTNSTGTYGSP